MISNALTNRQLRNLLVRNIMSMLFMPGGRSDEVPTTLAFLFCTGSVTGAKR